MLSEQITAAAGLPRCTHPRHAIGDAAAIERLRHRGRVRWCTCASARDVDPECPWVTWTAGAVLELDGDALILCDDALLAAHPEVAALPDVVVDRERLAEAVPRYAPEQVREARRAALRPTDPPPDDRRPR